MTRIAELLRMERRARIFFGLLTQSALGTGAAYVALLLIAYERFHSPWAISLVLMAELLPPMALGPFLGAAADRWSRRTCTVVADALRATAFIGIALVDGFALTMAFALVAGIGTALFTPASLAALPSLVNVRRLPLATALYGAISDVGLAVGPALTAAFLLIASPESILAVNALTFALSALILARLDFGQVPPHSETGKAGTARALVIDATAGVRAIRGVPGLWPMLGASGVALFFGGLVNVAELPFIAGDLGASDAAFSALVALVGLGIALGSLTGGAGGTVNRLAARFTLGLLLSGAGFTAAGLVPDLAVLFAMFMLAGFGNGLMLVHERLFIQATVPDEFSARVFGVRDAVTAWGFGVAFLAAGALVSAFGPQAVIVVAGAGVTSVGLAMAVWLRSTRGREELALRSPVSPSEAPDVSVRGWRA
jgi:MFS family permease